MLTVVACTTGCQVSIGAFSAQDAAQRSVESNPGTTGEVEIVSRRPWDGGVVVLYRTTRQSALGRDPLPVFGYEVVERRANGWWSIGGGGGSRDGAVPDQWVTYGVGRGGDQNGDGFTIVNGEVLAAEVQAVEVTFANGQTLRDPTTNDVFALTIPEQTAACALRVLSAQDQILDTINLAVLEGNEQRCSR